MRRINDALGRFYSTLVYVYLSVRLGKDRHIDTVALGKDRHIHIHIYACVHGHCMHCTERWRLRMRWRLLCRDGEGWQERERESATLRLVEGEDFCCSLYKQPLNSSY